MAEKDIAEKTFIALDDVFADIFNVLVFQGKRFMSEETLEDVKANSQYKADDGKLHEQERDAYKQWKGHGFNLILTGIENQTKPDKDMPFRVISYDGASYRSQLLWTEEVVNGESNRVSVKERHPVVTIVLYFGKELWNYPKNLKGCFEPKLPEDEITKLLDQYIQDYKITVFDIPRLPKETVQQFQSDFRVVAEYFTNVYTDREYAPSERVIMHVDEFLKLMKVLTGDDRYSEIAEMDGVEKEGLKMCAVLDYREAKGKAEGKAEVLASLMQKGRLTREEAAAEMSLTVEEFENFVKKIEADKEPYSA